MRTSPHRSGFFARSAVGPAWLLAGVLLWGIGAASADVVVRSGDHPGFGRLVFAFDERVGFNVTRVGDHVVIHFDRPDPVPAAIAPRYVLSYHGAAGIAELQLAPGARLLTQQIDNRVVVDVRAPEAAEPARPDSLPARPRAESGVGGRHVESALPLTAPQPPAASPPVTPPSAASPPASPSPAVPPAPGRSAAAAPPPETPPRSSGEPVVNLPVPTASNTDTLARAVEHALTAPVSPVGRQALPAPPGETAAARPSPQAAPSADAPAAPVASAPIPATPVPATPVPGASPAVPSAPPPPPILASPAAPALAVVARLLPTDGDAAGQPAGVLLPFERGTGAAAFRRGDNVLLVFDERRPIDLSAMPTEPGRPRPSVQLLPDATLVTIPAPGGQAVWLEPAPDGWVVRRAAGAQAAGKAGATLPVVPVVGDRQMRLPMHDAGRSIVVPDRMTGDNLIVGTQRRDAGAPAQGILTPRQSPGFVLLPSTQGVALEPFSDRISLSPAPDGFRLEAAGSELLSREGSDIAALVESAAFSRRFDFPARGTAELTRTMDAQVADAAAAPPRARLAPRLAAAQTMIALGLGTEAQALLRVALADDPQAAEAPDLPALSAIAGLLAGRDDADHGLEDPRLTGSDDIAFWRAVAMARQPDGAAAAAPVFAATLPLLLSYPATLRAQLLPMVAETLVQGGVLGVAEHLLKARPDDADLALARGLLAEARGENDAALADYDSLSVGRDRQVSARAADLAIALRLRTGRLDAMQAADALERGLFNWRDPARELPQRRQIAELRAQAHAWRPALAMLRETAQLFPESAEPLQADLHDMFAAMLRDQPSVGALDLVMIADENADLMRQGEAGAAAAMLLADRLETLDLPSRAIPLLDRLMRGANDTELRAQLGMRLAAMRLAQSDATGALASLATSDSANLPADLQESRDLLRARSEAATGDTTRAVALLAGLGTDRADLLRADLAGAAKNWSETEAALQAVASHLPDNGPLPESGQDILLRLASAAAQTGDEGQLDRLRGQDGRLDGKRADLFRMLTAPPVAGVNDLSRAARETTAARRVPAQLEKLAGAVPQR